MFIKRKFIVKLFKPKDCNKYVYQKKKKVIVKLFKPKDSNKCVYKKRKGSCETF